MNQPERHTILFFVRRVGPYHHSRFLAAATMSQLVVIQTRPDSQEYPWQRSEWTGYTIESFNNNNNTESGLAGAELKTAVNRVFDKYEPEVIVTTGWADHEYHVAMLESKRRKVPAVVISDSRYEDVTRKWHSEFIKKLLLKSYSSAIVAGTQSKSYMLRLGFDEPAIFAPWDVVDNDHFSDRSLNTTFDDRYFLCVSRFIEKKNLPALIDAYRLYHQSGGRRKLVFAGDGILSVQLKEQVGSVGLTDRIHFSGFVQYDRLPALLKNAYALILPSVSDQWGLVVNEAMAAGLPVMVSAQCGCAPDLVTDKQNGRIFDPYDQNSLREAFVWMDNVTEEQWTTMASRSVEIISSYQPVDFALALKRACEYAYDHPSRNFFPVIHKLLSK